MQHFFITGYPRSRTAWLANFLTHGPVLCLHDAMTPCDTPATFARLLRTIKGDGLQAVGHADPANLLFQSALLREFPSAKWILIERDPDQVERSAEAAFGSTPDLDAFRQAIRTLLDTIPAAQLRCVPFEELDTSLATDLGRWLCKDFRCHPERALMLNRLNVQLDAGTLAHDLGLIRDLGCPILDHAEFKSAAA